MKAESEAQRGKPKGHSDDDDDVYYCCLRLPLVEPVASSVYGGTSVPSFLPGKRPDEREDVPPRLPLLLKRQVHGNFCLSPIDRQTECSTTAISAATVAAPGPRAPRMDSRPGVDDDLMMFMMRERRWFERERGI